MSSYRVGINGFGRMGRLALRALWGREDLHLVAINEPHGSTETLALLTEFDSVQGRWAHTCAAPDEETILVDGTRLARSSFLVPAEIPWSAEGVDLVLECSGEFRTSPLLQGHFAAGASRVVVSAPVADGPPNIVVGVNHGDYDLGEHKLITAASCTTNGLAPIVRVLHDEVGIERGVVTTIHDPTNTQRVHDAPHDDPRRARAAQLSLIPTSTNSATAVTMIVPELAGRLDSIAVRAPVLNASLIDFVFHAERSTSISEVNNILAAAADGPLAGILGYEERPLVSADFAGDPRSAVIDALSTRVTDDRLVKVLAWYDNEWGYANRLVELAAMMATS
ncbi:MAG: type I glyceraldehyde-3-phosphate dehydrogenase [Planctomycetes bacterium]|nr:type I glyceraldehyde-3-phosphate dehydrogenase [Planctomycetota bacterium]MBV21148.1 type I glyceraldehyde-3-phosphate dehydrogenase [Planctomycetaceae bacterium]HJM57555.1 ArsJ-associated glyceraldehyde-3-phosphate dehydrogenase [Planctomycetota bacterium]